LKRKHLLDIIFIRGGDNIIFNRSVEIIFNKEDQLILDGQSKICNWLYNHLLEMVKNDKVSGLLAGRNLRNEIPKLKVEFGPYGYAKESKEIDELLN